MYSLKSNDKNEVNVVKQNGDLYTVFMLHPDNTDYQQFKRDIQANVQLTDASGNTITGTDLVTFLNSLP
jgi:hypothetical protein